MGLQTQPFPCPEQKLNTEHQTFDVEIFHKADMEITCQKAESLYEQGCSQENRFKPVVIYKNFQNSTQLS